MIVQSGPAVMLLLYLSIPPTTAQIRIYNPQRSAERSVENRANRRVDQSVNRGLDKLEEGIGNLFRKKKKKAPQSQTPADDTNDDQPDDNRSGGNRNGASNDNSASAGGGSHASNQLPEPASLKAYSKFDFVAGEKIVATEDFTQDAVGDFPARWNTNGTAEVVTIEGTPGRWLMIQKVDETSFIPDFVKDLPDNFTLEYDFVYSGVDDRFVFKQLFYTTFHETAKNADQITKIAAGRGATFVIDGKKYVNRDVELIQTDSQGRFTDLKGQYNVDEIINVNNNGKVIHVAIWRQKQRLRIYMNETKVFDLPRIFPADIQLNTMRFHTRMSRDQDRFFVSNIRLAVGDPDTRSKLITEGRFVTTGILFDVNSDKIRPESYGVLKDIARTLTENAGVRVKIIGHTDSDGDDAKNLDLSKRRAASVKAALGSEFGLDASRIDTDGKGETEPAAPNTSPEGKTNNRRVEFVKL